LNLHGLVKNIQAEFRSRDKIHAIFSCNEKIVLDCSKEHRQELNTVSKAKCRRYEGITELQTWSFPSCPLTCKLKKQLLLSFRRCANSS